MAERIISLIRQSRFRTTKEFMRVIHDVMLPHGEQKRIHNLMVNQLSEFEKIHEIVKEMRAKNSAVDPDDTREVDGLYAMLDSALNKRQSLTDQMLTVWKGAKLLGILDNRSVLKIGSNIEHPFSGTRSGVSTGNTNYIQDVDPADSFLATETMTRVRGQLQ